MHLCLLHSATAGNLTFCLPLYWALTVVPSQKRKERNVLRRRKSQKRILITTSKASKRSTCKLTQELMMWTRICMWKRNMIKGYLLRREIISFLFRTSDPCICSPEFDHEIFNIIDSDDRAYDFSIIHFLPKTCL